ncbi:MAG: Flp pilus assembly complex ATPase component [Alphaproteobacteria bacterium]|nr:Flp pilus assembly complex ATPase component [Alphaproteobacteria bacterium]
MPTVEHHATHKNKENNGKAVSQQKSEGTLVEAMFANNNKLLTAPGESLAIKDEIRELLGLFSDGRFVIAEEYKFDGRVLSFEVLARKRRLKVGKPEYVPLSTIEKIYTFNYKPSAATMAKIAAAEEPNLAAANKTSTPTQGKSRHATKKKGTSVAASSGASAAKANQSYSAPDEKNLSHMQQDFVSIIARAAALRVSDVHILVADTTLIMFRIDGLMQTELEYNNEWGEAFVRAAFASADISDANYSQNEYQAAQKSGTTTLRGSNGKLRLPSNVLGIRMQFNPIAFGSQYLVMRLLYADDDADDTGSITALGYTEMEAEQFFRMRAVPIGLCIVAGPTGSGKSTTLQRNMISLLKERNYEINLITVEDPPEYPIPGARQMPVTNATSEKEKDEQFTKALSAALRSDPDILMVGEIRTLSSADLTFKGALSGHGVWSTLHANSSPAILTRFMDLGVEPFKLKDPELVKGLISQRLFRGLCPHCSIPVSEKPDHSATKRVRRALGDFGMDTSYLRGDGCEFCNYRGLKGRQVVGEVIMPDASFLKLMLDGDTKLAIDYWTGELNGRTMKDAAIERMLQGKLDVEEVERWCGLLDQRPIY